MPRAVQSRSWCFTAFNTGLASDLRDKEINNDARPQLRYLVFQEEKCPETDRTHLQGYAQFKTPVRFAAFKRWLGDESAHVEQAKGSAQQNRDYCTKEDTRVDGPFEVGEFCAGAGQRTDLEGLKEALDSGANKRALWESQFPTMVRYHRAVDAYRLAKASNIARDPPEVTVYWGPTGTGKTRRVHHETGGNHFTVDIPDRGGSCWFDGYDGQEAVLIDDYGGEYNIHFLKRLLDRYNMNVQVKGGYTAWSPKHIYITSNMDPDYWYRDASPADRAAVRRRLAHIYHMASPWVPPEENDIYAHESPLSQTN